MARVIGEILPRVVFVENSSILTGRGLGRVLGDLAEMRYNARWFVLGADNIGAPHIRKRIWILAYSYCNGLERKQPETSYKTFKNKEWIDVKRMVIEIQTGKRDYIPESCVLRKGKRTSTDVDRLKTIGNSQVPQVAATAFLRMMEDI